MTWARRTDENPNSGENEVPGHDWAIFVHPNEKIDLEGLPEKKAEDAASFYKDLLSKTSQQTRQDATPD
jgi:hypothetical protein